MKNKGLALFVDGLGDAPKSFWKIADEFFVARWNWHVVRSSHEVNRFWTLAEEFYAHRLPIFYVGHSLGGSIVGPLSRWTPLDRVVTIDAVHPDWIGDLVTGDRSSLQPIDVRLISPRELPPGGEARDGRALSFIRKQGSNNRIMPGVGIKGWPIVRCKGGHNSIISEVADDVLKFLLAE